MPALRLWQKKQTRNVVRKKQVFVSESRYRHELNEGFKCKSHLLELPHERRLGGGSSERPKLLCPSRNIETSLSKARSVIFDNSDVTRFVWHATAPSSVIQSVPSLSLIGTINSECPRRVFPHLNTSGSVGFLALYQSRFTTGPSVFCPRWIC